jgi:hypothetical protein
VISIGGSPGRIACPICRPLVFFVARAYPGPGRFARAGPRSATSPGPCRKRL